MPWLFTLIQYNIHFPYKTLQKYTFYLWTDFSERVMLGKSDISNDPVRVWAWLGELSLLLGVWTGFPKLK